MKIKSLKVGAMISQLLATHLRSQDGKRRLALDFLCNNIAIFRYIRKAEG
jgi:hypothetical protein